MTRWLNLSSASKLLGVHPTTLRNWADAGKIPCYRTPGGHRRFRAEDIRAFLIQTSHAVPVRQADEHDLLTTALVETRRELAELPAAELGWYSKFDEAGIEHQRMLGRSLFEKAIRYLVLRENREKTLEEGRELGRAYAASSLRYDISLLETVRAFQYFRQQLWRSIMSESEGRKMGEENMALFREDFDRFFDEVLFGLIEAYEQQLISQNLLIEERPPQPDEGS